ncbi:unnamed protein product [Protopolystoma xenopodis]|uniref:Uncharacterized protein n=1 Tax=Protopolystoma xenopodis TaxID=117903 RepID=A0A448WZX5_9PLAT|nr:unnamed protein product [Protopolystoma xenopodis]
MQTEPKMAAVDQKMKYQNDSKEEDSNFHQSADATPDDGQTVLIGGLLHQMRVPNGQVCHQSPRLPA